MDLLIIKPYRYFLVCLLLITSACSLNSENKTYEPEYSSELSSKTQVKINILFGIHPLHNPQRLFEIFNPLMSYLENQLPEYHFMLEASKDYASFEEKLSNKEFHIALPNPYQTIKIIDTGYSVFAKMNDDEKFKGILLAKKNSAIKKISDLKGKKISFPAKTALAGSMMPQYYLHQHGLNLHKDISIKYVGSQESSVLSVFHNESAAGATWPGAWNIFKTERPEVEKELFILFETSSLPSNSLVYRNDLDQQAVNKIKDALLNLEKTEQGKSILKTLKLTKFVTANNDTYKPVKDFIKKFDTEIGQVNEK